MDEPASIAQQIEHVARALADAVLRDEVAAFAAAVQTLKAVPGLLRAAERVLEDATATRDDGITVAFAPAPPAQGPSRMSGAAAKPPADEPNDGGDSCHKCDVNFPCWGDRSRCQRGFARKTNLPPADELAEVRDQIKALESREEELKTLMLTDKSARTGNRFVVEIVPGTQSRFDVKEFRKMYPALAEEYTFNLKIEKVELRVIDDETGEILARPRGRNAPSA